MRVRLLAMILALASALTACGQLLGTEDEEASPPSTPDASSSETSTVDAATGSADAGRICEQLFEDFASYTDNTQLPAKRWRRFFGAPNCATLGFDGGAFVTEVPSTPSDDAAACSSNAGLFRWFEGGVRTIECSFDVTVTSFDGNTGFFEYRVEGTDYTPFVVSAGVRSDLGAYVRRVATRDGSVVIDGFDPTGNGVPEAGVPFRVHGRLDLGAKSFTFQLNDASAPFGREMPDPGAPPLVELYVGVTDTNRPRTVTIDNVSCEACR